MSKITRYASSDMMGSAICDAIGLDPGKVTLLKIAADFDAANRDIATIDATIACTVGEAEAIAEVLRGNAHSVTLNVVEADDE